MIGGRSAIVIPIRLPDALEAIRLAHVSNAHLGVPAHVTLLFPFVPADALGPPVIQRAARAVRATAAFEVEFRDVTSFGPDPTPEAVVWLPPEPAMPFRALTEALSAAFPGYLPYEGSHDEVIPHLTLADRAVDGPGIQGAARPHLPFRRRVASAVLLVEGPDNRWRVLRRLALA